MRFSYIFKFQFIYIFAIVLCFLLSSEVFAQNAHEPWEGAYSSGEFEGGVIREVYCDLVSLVEDAFGGLLFAAAGIMAFGFAVFGNGRHAYTAVIAAVGAFTMSAAVSLYFGDLGCGGGGGGAQAQRTKKIESPTNRAFKQYMEKEDNNIDNSLYESLNEEPVEHELF